MFTFFKEKITKALSSLTRGLQSFFSNKTFDDQAAVELESILLTADTGTKTTDFIIQKLKEASSDDLKKALSEILINILATHSAIQDKPKVVVLVGINGSGKTTFISKYAHFLKQEGKRVLVVAADTFRAAAVDQLAVWTKKIGVDLVQGQHNQEPAAVVFDGCKKFVEGQYDHIIIDTAGRLQTKVNLMKELEKIVKIVSRHLPHEQVALWLTVDAMLGQNVMNQVELFNQAAQLSGLVLTKMDGTGKGGIVFGLAHTYKLPVVYMTFGENPEDIKRFDPKEFIDQLLN